jgi:hypothetical protein
VIVVDGIIIKLRYDNPVNGFSIESPVLHSLEDICEFVKKECENGTFDGPDNDDGYYTGKFELKDRNADKTMYRIVIGRHESESRTNGRIVDFSKSANLKEMAEAILKATPETYFMEIEVLPQ